MRNIFEYHDEGIYLEHHGILGQKWGIRRYQNRDGSLTEAGKKRYREVSDGLDSDTSHYIYDVQTGKASPPYKQDPAELKAHQDHEKRIEKKAEDEVKTLLNMPKMTQDQRIKKLQAERKFLKNILDPNNVTDLNMLRGFVLAKRIYELYPDGSQPTEGTAKRLGFTDNVDNDIDLVDIWAYFG